MNFTTRLKRAKAKSGLTVDELGLWLGGIHRQTVWTWLQGRQPQAYRMQQVLESLEYLERETGRKNARLPPPLEVRQGEERHAYVRTIRGKYGRLST